MAKPNTATAGPIATEEYERLLPVLRRAWESPFTTRSDFARRFIEDVAVAACLGLLTVKHNNTLNEWGRTWRITAAGLSLLEKTP
ncbi:hypothetical protein SAMN06296065_102494 [Novosphingobium panipatense]|uniref:Uncharacterized protein n=1 Tax=Novosphingobium panipatense TaxID=428991 RepID=A0ABY1Q7Z7_9SPHN|nr:hypothetical protein SAMN06296065_102494 [Novosphingobium panipatense]